MLSHTVTSPRTQNTATITVNVADVIQGTWTGTVVYKRHYTVGFCANRDEASFSFGHKTVVLNRGALDERDLDAEELIEACQIMSYMWAQIAKRAQADRVAGLLRKAAEFALDGETEKAARMRAAALA